MTAALGPLGVAVCMALLGAPGSADEPAAAARTPVGTEGWTRPPWGFVALPLLGLNVDEGIGGGAVFAVHHYDDDSDAIRDDFALRVFLTSKWVQRHELKWEGIDVLDLPVRILTRVGLFSTVTQNFCGTGNGLRCDPAAAAAAAQAAGFTVGSDAHDAFVAHYFQTRFWRVYGDVLLRWRVFAAPQKVELMGGARVAWNQPGDFTTRRPYPGSLYAASFPEGEPGVTSVLLVGATWDRRDLEASPRRGFFAETSVRGASPLWGSTWSFLGLNAAGSLYVPLPLQVVLGLRLVGDLLVGDPPTEELALVGGTRDLTAFGGQWMGRGLRDRRALGAVKLIGQLEVRRGLFDVVVLGVRFDVGAGVFGDAGWIGAALDDFGGGARGADGVVREVGSPTRVLFGTGVGLRLLINRALLMRIDVAWSPFEAVQPSFYSPFGHPL